MLPSIRSSINLATRGDLIEKTVAEALELLERVTYHNFEWSNERGDVRKAAGVLELDALSMINSQFDQLTKRLNRMQANVIGANNQFYNRCGGGHIISECSLYSEPFTK